MGPLLNFAIKVSPSCTLMFHSGFSSKLIQIIDRIHFLTLTGSLPLSTGNSQHGSLLLQGQQKRVSAASSFSAQGRPKSSFKGFA